MRQCRNARAIQRAEHTIGPPSSLAQASVGRAAPHSLSGGVVRRRARGGGGEGGAGRSETRSWKRATPSKFIFNRPGIWSGVAPLSVAAHRRHQSSRDRERSASGPSRRARQENTSTHRRGVPQRCPACPTLTLPAVQAIFAPRHCVAPLSVAAHRRHQSSRLLGRPASTPGGGSGSSENTHGDRQGLEIDSGGESTG